ncbi:hypothetical protein ACFX13_012660 [Malus domestica]
MAARFQSIKINQKVGALNTSLLAIDNKGYGGTKISTVNPYTVLETSIYNTMVNTFMKEVANIPKVKPITPFGACFSLKNIGFVDGGKRPKTSIVIGGHQLEDNLLQFDLATSRLGFSSSLLFRRTTCVNFNFTSNA